MITTPTITAKRIPVTRGSIPNSPFMAPAISLDWEIFPIPKEAKPPNRANKTARGFHPLPSPFSM
jgi:hypothetical protein